MKYKVTVEFEMDGQDLHQDGTGDFSIDLSPDENFIMQANDDGINIWRYGIPNNILEWKVLKRTPINGEYKNLA